MGCTVAATMLQVSIAQDSSFERRFGLQEELGISTAYGSEESIPISGSLGNRLAEGERVDFADIASQVEMMCCDGCLKNSR